MKSVFAHIPYEQNLQSEGYVVLPAFIPEDLCDLLISLHNQNGHYDARPFSITNWGDDVNLRNQVYKAIVSALLPYAEKYIPDYRPVMGVFTVKQPGDNSAMLLHQDWSLVDETINRSVSIWVALCDMDHRNGNLQVAPRSHLYCNYPRGMNFGVPFESIRTLMHEKYLLDVPLRKGDAVVFDHRLIHASPPNLSDRVRLAAVLALIPKQATLVHYYRNPNNEIELLELDDEAFRLMNYFDAPNKPPHQVVLRTFNLPHFTLSEADIHLKYKMNELVG